jgi:hypothetical protein
MDILKLRLAHWLLRVSWRIHLIAEYLVESERRAPRANSRKAIVACVLFMLPLAGCINVRTELTPVNAMVEPRLTGEDCTLMFLGFSFGTNRYSEAVTHAGLPSYASYDPGNHRATIQRVHSTTLHFWQFGSLVGEQCLEVRGES